MTSQKKWVLETDDATFAQDVIERSKEVPVVVDFWAEWCQPCLLVGPTLERLATEFDGKFVLVKADLEQTPAVAQRLGVSTIPAVYGFRDGELRDFIVGAWPERQLQAWIERLLPTEAEQRVAEADRIVQVDPQEAEPLYRQALELDPTLAKAKIGLAAVLLSQGRFAECQELTEELERRGFLEPAARKVKADLELHRQAREVGSVAECRLALQSHPEDPCLQLKLAEALAGTGQYQEALAVSLALVQDHKQQFGEPARKIMGDIFQVLPNDSELTSTYRRELAAALY